VGERAAWVAGWLVPQGNPPMVSPPMADLLLSGDALASYLPHRGVNLLPDSVRLNAERTHAESHTLIQRHDPRGREIVGRTGPDGRPVWYEPMLAELMALTGVPLLHERLAPLGQVSVFSMISRLVFHQPMPLHGEIVGHATITRDRAGFTVFSTRAEHQGALILDAEVMSGSAVLSEIASAPIRPLVAKQGGHALDGGPFAWKSPVLRFIDRVVEHDRATGRLIASYHYPHDHPFVPGHFPGAALMMGVTQWAMVADAAWAARTLFGLESDISASGVVRRQDGSEIIDVRDVRIRCQGGLPYIQSTKRLAFREPMRPGDGVLIDVLVQPLPAA
jgi:3-hydroxymyristoyl/3-hydroxydecanoyl-(acyl carrier protein) dehydratase